MSFLGGHRRIALGELIFDAGAAGERRKKLCVWRFDAYDPYTRSRKGPYNHTRANEWSHLLSENASFAPVVDFEEWEQGPILADMADAGRILFGTKTKAELVQWFGKDAMKELMQTYGFYPRKVAARRVWLSKSGVQVAYEPAFDERGQEIPCT